MEAREVEVSYQRKVNLGNYSNVDLGGRIILDVFDDPLEAYRSTQEMLKVAVDKIADRIADEAKLSQRSK